MQAQSLLLTQSIMGDQRFNSVYLPYNSGGNYVLDSIVVNGGNDLQAKYTPLKFGPTISGYTIAYSKGKYKNGMMFITFNGNNKPASYKTYLHNNVDHDTLIGTIDYSPNGKQNFENVAFNFSDNANTEFTKTYEQGYPYFLNGPEFTDTMHIDIMGGVHNHNYTAFRFDGYGKILSFKSLGNNDSAEYHYNNAGLPLHIHYQNGDEVEYFWSIKTGISDLKPNELSIYPNPTSDVLYFSHSTEKVLLFDCNGKLILAENNVNSISLSLKI